MSDDYNPASVHACLARIELNIENLKVEFEKISHRITKLESWQLRMGAILTAVAVAAQVAWDAIRHKVHQ